MTPITVEIVQSPGERRIERQHLVLPADSTVAEALRAAGIDPGAGSVAVWGRRAAPHQALRTGDRIELLRPLQIDPKEARRLRAKRGMQELPLKTERPAKAGR
jgi:uncharacterized protein